jgi:Leucine-rich repeat (LRR) protein
MLDFAPPANLEVIDYSHNQIEKIENVCFNPYVKHLCLDDNKIKKIEGINGNKSLISLSLRQNNITHIENLDDLNL